MARAAARKAEPKEIRIPLKKETALRLTQLQAEFEVVSQQANAAIGAARQRVVDTLGIVCSENGIDPTKATPVQVTSAEPFELVLQVIP